MINLEKLKREYKYKIDFHTHTRPASPCSDISPSELVDRYIKKGFDGIVLTNHFIDFLLQSEDAKEAADIYLNDYHETRREGEKAGLKVYLGMEARFTDNCNDYLIYGITEEDVKKVFSFIKGDFKTFYKGFKNDKNVILQAHPFRNGMTLQDPKLLDGIEVYNVHPNHNSRVAVANAYANRYPHFIKTCGTDFHHAGHEGLGATRLKVLPENSVELAKILKSKDYIFDIAGSIVLPY